MPSGTDRLWVTSTWQLAAVLNQGSLSTTWRRANPLELTNATSMRYRASRPDDSPAANRKQPAGSMSNERGVSSVGVRSTAVSRPLAGSMRKAEMLSWPRLDAYR
jgi:hypothetical protein